MQRVVINLTGSSYKNILQAKIIEKIITDEFILHTCEARMKYEGGSKSYSDSSGEWFEIAYDRQARTGRKPQSRVRVIKNRNGIGGYFPRNAEGYFQSPMMA